MSEEMRISDSLFDELKNLSIAGLLVEAAWVSYFCSDLTYFNDQALFIVILSSCTVVGGTTTTTLPKFFMLDRLELNSTSPSGETRE